MRARYASQVPSPSIDSRPAALAWGAFAAAAAVLVLWWITVGGDAERACRDDCQVQHAPAARAIGEAWLRGEIPLLEPRSWFGGALAAEHQYGVLSPALALAYSAVAACDLAPLGAARLLAGWHLALLAAGCFVLARARGLIRALAVAVSLGVAGNGYVLTWAASDWLPALASLAWLPWFGWALGRSVEDAPRRWRWAVAAALLLALVLLAGWPHTSAMALLLAASLGLESLRDRRFGSAWPALATALALGLALASPALLLAGEWYFAGARRLWPPGDEGEWTVPLSALLGWLAPWQTSDWEPFLWRRPHAAIELAGGPLFVLGIVAGLARRRRFLRAAAGELLLLAVATLLMVLPGLPGFRWSFRWIPLAALALALAGARGWQAWSEGRRLAPWLPWLPAALTFALSAAALHQLPQLDGAPRWRLDETNSPGADSPSDRLGLALYARGDLLERAESASPTGLASALLPGALPLVSGGEWINGYSPFEPLGLARLLWMRSFGEIHPARAERLLQHEAGAEGLLAALGVSELRLAARYRGRAADLERLGWTLAGELPRGGLRLVRPALPRLLSLAQAHCATDLESQARWLDARPRQVAPWVVPCAPGERAESALAFGSVELDEPLVRRRSVEVAVRGGDREGLVVFRRPLYPGTRAWLAGRELPVEPISLALAGVRLPAASAGTLVLAYAPRSLEIGAALAALAALVAALLVTRERRRAASDRHG